MIVCISGPSSTGKTTLLNELVRRREFIESIYQGDVEFNEELIRTICNKFDDTSLDSIINDPEEAIKFQLEIADKLYVEYMKMIKYSDKLFICDRSPLDNLVYDLLNYQSDNPELMNKYSRELNVACSNMRALYSYVDRIYLTQVDIQNESNIENDGFRPRKYEHRRQLEIELFNSIFDFNPRVIKLPPTLNERVTTILTDFSTLLRKE